MKSLRKKVFIVGGIIECEVSGIPTESIGGERKMQVEEDMMETGERNERPRIDYFMILIPVMYWIILILESVIRK